METKETKNQSIFANIFANDTTRENATFGEVETTKSVEELEKELFKRKGVKIMAKVANVSAIYSKLTESGERAKVAINLCQYVPTYSDGKESKGNTIFLYISQLKAILANSGFSFVDTLFKNRDFANFLSGCVFCIGIDKAAANMPYTFADSDKTFTFDTDRFVYYVTRAAKAPKYKEFEEKCFRYSL